MVRVEAYMRAQALCVPGKGIVCAVSGGPDSVALLRILHGLRSALGIDVAACHFEHGIRAQDSLDDMRFVKTLCDGLQIPLYTEQADIPAQAAMSAMGLESAARRARHAFYERARLALGADRVALGHHMDDQAETVLMHLSRGSRGAVGMPVRAGRLIRPLLCLRRREILAYLQEIGQAYCTDATNAVADNPRNRLRMQAMPVLESIYPGAVPALFRAADYMGRDDAYLTDCARQWLREHEKRDALCYEALPPEPVFRRALLLFCAGRGKGQVQSTQLERLIALAKARTGTRAALMGQLYERTKDGLAVVPPSREMPEVPLLVPGDTRFGEDLFTATLTDQRPDALSLDGGNTQTLDADHVPPLTVRLRKTGDRMHMLGAPGSKPLKKILIDRGIPRAHRERIPVLAHGQEIIWMPGLPPSHKARVSQETKHYLTIHYIQEI